VRLGSKTLEMVNTDTEIQGYSDGVFWERNTLALQQKAKLKSHISTSKQQSLRLNMPQ
jgi:site-specific DNA-methyltransferase (adenine-specific)